MLIPVSQCGGKNVVGRGAIREGQAPSVPGSVEVGRWLKVVAIS